MASISTIGPFTTVEEDFETYCSRVELFFLANSIEDAKKVPAFLTLIGPKVFALSKSLLSPKEPAACKYGEIVEALKKHYKPKVIQIYERFKFYSRNKKSGESIADFVAGIKALAHTCNFGDQLTDMLRDRFVMGLSNEGTQHFLLAEPDLTFKHAVDVATAREAAMRDVQTMGVSSHNVHSIKSNQNFLSIKSTPKSNNSKKPTKSCSGCGKRHWRKDCPYKDAECFNCHKKGHRKNMCFTKGGGNGSNKQTSNSYQGRVNTVLSESNAYQTKMCPVSSEICDEYLYPILSDKVSPISVPILVNDKETLFELDMGAARTIMSKVTYEKLWSESLNKPMLKPCKINLKVYGGVPLNIAGEIEVTAKVKELSCLVSIIIIIIEGEGPCLLGRDLIAKLKLNDIKLSDIHSVANTSLTSTQLVNEFPSLFAAGLGCLKGKTFTLNVNDKVPPKFCKARTVPYTLKDKVSNELDRLVEEGIISPVSYSPWAAAIVPVLKPDGSVRICGDYKLTVNRAVEMDTYPIPKVEDLFSTLSGGTLFTKLDMSQAYAVLNFARMKSPNSIQL